MYCYVYVYVYTGFGFGNRIYFTLAQLVTTLHKSLYSAVCLISQLQSSLTVARQWLQMAGFPLSLCSRTIHGFSYQLSTATAHSNRTQMVPSLVQVLIRRFAQQSVDMTQHCYTFSICVLYCSIVIHTTVSLVLSFQVLLNTERYC